MTQERAHRAWRTAERIKRLSDRLVGVGPFGLGLDGVLAWIPGAGTAYSAVAGLLLPAQDEALTVKATRNALAKLDADPSRLMQ